MALPGADRSPDSLRKLEVPDAARGRPFAALCLALVATGLAGAVGVNVAVDPRDEFGREWLPPAVPDEIALGVSAWHDLGQKPDNFVFGSSRARPFASIPGVNGTWATAAVHGGSVEDIGHLYGFMVRDGHTPGAVLAVIDQFAFTPELQSAVERSPARDEVLGRASPWTEDAVRLARTLDAAYVRDSARSLYFAVAGYPPLPGDESQPHPAFADPHLMQRWQAGEADLRAVRPGVYDSMARAFGPDGGHVPAKQRSFEGFVASARGNGTELWLLVPPIQPVALADFRANFPGFGERSAEVRAAVEAACGPGVHAFDYTDIASFGGDPAEFVDHTHFTPANARLAEAAMARGDGDLCAQGPSAPADSPPA